MMRTRPAIAALLISSLASALVAGCAATPAPAPEAPLPPLTDRYRFVPVGGPPGCTSCEWQAINGKGVLAGQAFRGETATAVVARPRAGGGYEVVDLGPAPGGAPLAAAAAINDAGVIAGSLSFGEDSSHVFIARPGPDGRYATVDLGVPPGAKSAGATGINADGVLCGYAERPQVDEPDSLATRAFVARPDAAGRYTFQDLGAPAGFVDSDARAIDRAGVVLGNATDAGMQKQRPFVARPTAGGAYEWVALPLPPHGAGGAALGLGEGGVAVGGVHFGAARAPTPCAVVWTPLPAGGYEVHPLDVLPGARSSSASGVNGRGAVIGRSTGEPRRVATLWIALPAGPGAWRVTALRQGVAGDLPEGINAAGAVVLHGGIALPEHGAAR